MSETEQYIKLLEDCIRKRNELIYAMMYNTHSFMNFVRDKSIDIDELYKKFNTEKVIDKVHAKNRIDLLSNDIKEITHNRDDVQL